MQPIALIIRQNFIVAKSRCYKVRAKIWNFDDRRSCCILFLDRTAAERILNFQTQIGRNSKSHEYCFRRQPSLLSDGPINGSKRLVINELRQSETRLVAKTIFLTDHTYLYKIGFWQNFIMTFPETLHTKKMSPMNSAFRLLLI
jgi:hypothetical protein